MRRTRVTLALLGAGALLMLPVAVAGAGNGCEKTPLVRYKVNGDLVSLTVDDPGTPEHEGTVTLTVTSANAHARDSGEIADQDPGTPGVQVAGAVYTVPSSDAYLLTLKGYEDPDTPSPGDRVKVRGKIAKTKKRCAPEGTSEADRYAAPDVRRVTILDRDADA